MKLTEVKLKDISKNNRGYYGIGASAVDYDENKYTYLRITDINDDGTLNKTALMSVDDEKACDFLLKENDIVFARTGASTGRNYFYDDEIKDMVFAGFLIKFSLDEEKVNPRFIKYYCISQNYKNWIESSLTGSTRPNINEKQLSEMPIILPEREYQNRVVKVLDAIIKKIELNNKINDNLHEIAENYFLEVSKNGKEVKLEELLYEIQSGSREKGGAVTSGIPSIGAEKIEKLGVYNFGNEKYISEQYFQKMKNGIVKSGDVLLYKDGAYAGKVSMALNDFPHKKCAINEHVFILRTENNWANCYLYFLLYYSKTKEQLQAMASSKAAQPGLNQTEVKDVKVKIPPKEKIEEFEKNIKIIVEKIIENSIENRNLEQLRDTLLPKLMNGEIDLENVEI